MVAFKRDTEISRMELENYSSHIVDTLGIVELLYNNGLSHLTTSRGCVRLFDHVHGYVQVIIYDVTDNDYNEPVAILNYAIK